MLAVITPLHDNTNITITYRGSVIKKLDGLDRGEVYQYLGKPTSSGRKRRSASKQPSQQRRLYTGLSWRRSSSRRITTTTTTTTQSPNAGKRQQLPL